MIEAMLMMAAAAGTGAGMGECPAIRIDTWGSEHLTESYFVARVDPMPAGPLTYRWSVDKGALHVGEAAENASVRVDLGELAEGDVGYDLTVDIGGLPKGCAHRVTRRHVEPRFAGMPDPCPKAKLDFVADKIGIRHFTLTLDPMPAGPLRYDWGASEGVILSGQGTPAIVHKLSVAGSEGQIIDYNLTVKIGGLPEGCPPLIAWALQLSA